MQRLFETSKTREQVTLDGPWRFVTDPDDVGRDEGYHESFPADSDELYVPGVWNTLPEYYSYEGAAWYSKTFKIQERSNAKLTFAAVAHDAEVYLDGEQLGSHYGGYTPFSFHLPDLAGGDHELVVRVDNTHDETTIPKSKVDWTHYGGISRDVLLEKVGEVVIDDLRVDYSVAARDVAVEPTVTVYTFDAPGEYEVNVSLGDKHRSQTTARIESGKDRTTATTKFTLADARLWSPDDPQLYEVGVEVADDDYHDRVGFRSVEVTATDILINGEIIEIDGVNRHEDHPEWGHGLPPRIMKRDLDILQDAGLNAVRTSHYPNHPVFLDYCDQEGIVVIEEIPYWQYDEDDFARDVVLDRGKRMLTEMITRDYNRPSIISWSLHNECETHQQGVYDATRKLAKTARTHDESRPLTFATNNHYLGEDEVCGELADFLCINGYWGWYSEEKQWKTFLEEIRNEFPETPIVVSEFGAGAVEGERGFEARKWSETYQAEALDSAIRTFKDTEYVSGYFVWQYFDTNTSDSMTMSRPKAMNNKGILDAYRRPKDGYWALKRLLTKE